MMTPDTHISQSHNCTITITPDNYISEMISQVGGFCALSGVFILTLPIPIVVNRFLKIDLTCIAITSLYQSTRMKMMLRRKNSDSKLIFSFAMYYKNRLWRTEVRSPAKCVFLEEFDENIKMFKVVRKNKKDVEELNENQNV